MTSAPHTPAERQSPLRRFVGLLTRRVQEPDFWRIHAMVLVISAVHVALETDLVTIEWLDRLPQAIQHLPVALYVIPVAYAGLVYGFEGGVFTALWVSLLASSNVALWHRHDFEWVTEIALMLIVVVVGVAMSIPVERERRQRRTAEVTSRRLAIVNDVIQSSLSPWGPDQIARTAVLKLAEVPDLAGTSIVLWTREGRELLVTASHALDAHTAAELDALVNNADADTFERVRADGDLLHVPLTTERLVGGLAVSLRPGRPLTAGHMEFLRAIGTQLVVSIEGAMLRQQERDALESYVRLVTRAQEEERKHIARELHDGAVQQLAVLCRSIDDVAETTSPDRDRTLERLRGLAASTLEDLRQFSRDLRPSLLDDLGIVPALEWLVLDMGDRAGIPAGLSIDGEARRTTTEVEVALYRIVQEALRNVERHAEATRVDVVIRFEPGRILISVRDDGRGFQVPADLGTLVSSGKLGLMGMQERAQLAGGTFELQSRPGAGSVVTTDVPG